MRICTKSKFGWAVLITCMIVITTACNMTFQSIEAKNEKLANAQAKLLANPNDKQALSVILRMLSSDNDTVARSNAAASLGTLGRTIKDSIKDEAVPALVKALDHDNIFVKRNAAQSLRAFGPDA
jgi:HEAT repeat protein